MSVKSLETQMVDISRCYSNFLSLVVTTITNELMKKKEKRKKKRVNKEGRGVRG